MTRLTHGLKLTLLCILWPLFALTQQSDLYLFDLIEVDGKYDLHRPRFLSGFNPEGYTNQPAFTDPYTMLVTAAPNEDLLKTDIYSLDILTRKLTRITQTEDREYSPTPSIKIKNQFICVVVDVNHQNQQILWQYPLDRSGGGQPLLKEAINVGYFCEMRNGWMAVFEVGTPNKLHLFNEKTGDKKLISTNIGRSFQLLRTGHLVYVHKFSEDYWFLKKLNPDSFTSEIIKKTLPGSEDFIVLSDDSILMGQGNKIYRLNHQGENQWQEISNLEPTGLTNIKRMAFNGINQLAVVDQK